MTATEIEKKTEEDPRLSSAPADKGRARTQIDALVQENVEQFDQILNKHLRTHALFAAIGLLEISLFILFFTRLAQSSVLALSLALLFFTLFSYLVVRLYLNTQKPEELLQLRNHFIQKSKERIGYQEGVCEHHMALANGVCWMATALNDREYTYYRPKGSLEFLAPTLELFSCWWHWQDLHIMKESLMLVTIEEHIKLVKCEPTSLRVHAALANAYVILSGLYANPKKCEGYNADRWIPPARFGEAMQEQFRTTAKRAIEEFKILNAYAPEDPWVHAQLAYSYHDLQMPEEEIKQYETLLKLRPNDNEILLKLGVLYFQQGRNADGLHIYEQLKERHFHKAESLIKFYGEY